MRYKLLGLGILTCAVGAFALFGQAAVPQNMNVQGQISDASGAPIGPKVFIFTFKIFDMAVGGVEIWPAGPGENQAIATDDNGTWNAILGEVLGLSPDVFADTSRWLEITVDDGDLPPETLTRIKLNMSPYTGRASSSKVADNGVPVGAVIDWWRPNAGFPVPTGFQICDGSMVVDAESPLNGETLPDLRIQFVRGANVIGDIGITGGVNTHGHSLTVNSSSHMHSVDPPSKSSNSVNLAHGHSHNHGNLATGTGSDSHSHFHDHPNTGSSTVFSHNATLAGGFDNLSHPHVGTHGHSVNLGGITSTSDVHSHSVNVNLPSIGSSANLGNHAHSTNIGSFNSASTGHNHTGSNGTGDNVPAYTVLLKIMRIK